MNLSLFRNARIFTPRDTGGPLAGEAQDRLAFWEHGALLCENGRILRAGPEAEVLAGLGPGQVTREVDCRGRCLIPGLVDPHTHMCFVGLREAEFAQRVEGKSYLEILEAGGGILATVAKVRAASQDELLAATLAHLVSALALGSTTVEIKSGYGLEPEAEIKMLEVIAQAGRQADQDVVATFLGAHAVPPEYAGRVDAYVELVAEEMIPRVAQAGLARFCDVFCEEAVFNLGRSRQVLAAARRAGMGLKLHADEITDSGGAGLAAELEAVSAEHLLSAGHKNLAAMARAGVIAVLLPITSLCLQKPPAQARLMIELGLPVALATDMNPGSSYSESMPLAFALAVFNLEMSIAEALNAATLNAAYALGLGEKLGSLDAGKQADFLLLEGESPAILAYHTGVSPVSRVYKKGELVYSRSA